MKTLKNILATVLALWALISFIISFAIIFLPSMACWLLPEPLGQRIFIGIARIWMSIWLPLTGCPVKIKGREHFRKGQSFIVTFNHNSMMDIPLSCPFVPGGNKTIAKNSFVKVPIFGFYYMKGAVLVDRKSEQSRKKSYEKMKSVLARGMHMCIYPEGTRNRTADPLKKFHDGAFRLAVETGHPIIPAIIFSTKKILPPGKGLWFWPRKIEMHFLPEISPAGKSVESLKEEVFRVMSDHYRSGEK